MGMPTGLKTGLKNYFRVPFVMIVWVMETYTKNRESVREFMAKPRIASAFKVVLTLTALAWVIVAWQASEEDGSRLTDAMKGFWSDAQDLNDQKKQLNLEKEQAIGGPAQ
ncbi:MAG: hypothetical protein COB59_05600 [Rhodospirillaceae bacterium]|nr:MAG: hypothetical protein COB59_05600 [Rhodospirillaceae bacterium]